jgi:hypothetical protein
VLQLLMVTARPAVKKVLTGGRPGGKSVALLKSNIKIKKEAV